MKGAKRKAAAAQGREESRWLGAKIAPSEAEKGEDIKSLQQQQDFFFTSKKKTFFPTNGRRRRTTLLKNALLECRR